MRGRKRHRKKESTIRLKIRHVKIVARPVKLNVTWSLDDAPSFFAYPLLGVSMLKDEDDPPA